MDAFNFALYAEHCKYQAGWKNFWSICVQLGSPMDANKVSALAKVSNTRTQTDSPLGKDIGYNAKRQVGTSASSLVARPQQLSK